MLDRHSISIGCAAAGLAAAAIVGCSGSDVNENVIVFNGEANRLNAYAPDDGNAKQTVIEQRALDPNGWDINAQICFDPSATVLWTDVGQRWSVEEFAKEITPNFASGKRLRLNLISRSVEQLTEGVVAFDEQLISETYKRCRTSGLLAETDGRWKTKQLNLSCDLPIALDLVETAVAP